MCVCVHVCVWMCVHWNVHYSRTVVCLRSTIKLYSLRLWMWQARVCNNIKMHHFFFHLKSQHENKIDIYYTIRLFLLVVLLLSLLYFYDSWFFVDTCDTVSPRLMSHQLFTIETIISVTIEAIEYRKLTVLYQSTLWCTCALCMLTYSDSDKVVPLRLIILHGIFAF